MCSTFGVCRTVIHLKVNYMQNIAPRWKIFLTKCWTFSSCHNVSFRQWNVIWGAIPFYLALSHPSSAFIVKKEGGWDEFIHRHRTRIKRNWNEMRFGNVHMILSWNSKLKIRKCVVNAEKMINATGRMYIFFRSGLNFKSTKENM